MWVSEGREGVVKDIIPEKVKFETRSEDMQEGTLRTGKKEECFRQKKQLVHRCRGGNGTDKVITKNKLFKRY